MHNSITTVAYRYKAYKNQGTFGIVLDNFNTIIFIIVRDILSYSQIPPRVGYLRINGRQSQGVDNLR